MNTNTILSKDEKDELKALVYNRMVDIKAEKKFSERFGVPNNYEIEIKVLNQLVRRFDLNEH